jgi:hypothetical protein
MSIPTWSYDEEYYASLTKGEKVYIRTDEIKGKGLFAKKALKKDELALVEAALCCTQNVDDCMKNIPICGLCLVSLETPRQIVSRISRNKTLGSELPCSSAFRKRTVVRCKFYEDGCPMVFCSARCQEQAWSRFHFAGCRGCMSEEGKAAFDQLLANPWQQGGIDYSDTHFVAFRFMCMAVTRHRLHKQDLAASYSHIAQLIRAPLEKFFFTFLLRDQDEFEAKIPAETKTAAYWQRFVEYRGKESQHPDVVKANEEGPDKPSMLAEGSMLLSTIFRFSAAEKEFFTVEKWSELLGAVLLNGQERTPNSPYYEYAEMMDGIPNGERDVKIFTQKVRATGHDPSRLNVSTRGQGIYTVGCLFNHSCSPNLQILYTSENDETLVAVCMRDIEQDEELCISYIDESIDVRERQIQLSEHYLFSCRCTKCVRDLTKMERQKPGKDGGEGVQPSNAEAHADPARSE